MRNHKSQHSRLLARRNPNAATRQRSPSTDELILIVEMNEWTSGSLPLQLRQVGHDVRVAQGKKVALEQLKHVHPRLLIVGGSADLDFYHTLRHTLSSPILALASWADKSQTLAAFAAGVDDYQAGSIGDDEVVMRARVLLRRAKRSALATAAP